MSRVLVIAPHMDDEVLGCGGTICRYKKTGDHVSVIFAAHRVYDHVFDKKRNEIEKKHARKAMKVLRYDDCIFLDLPDERLDTAVQDIIIPLEKYLDEIKPDTVYVPFRGDNNQDHRAVFDAARVALRPAATAFVKHIMMYEVSSSTEQSPPSPETAFMPNHYVDIGGFMNRKLRALGCYMSEARPYPHPRSAEALKVLSQKRGIEIGYEYAEAFMIVRSKWG